jgi:hypothetical protein
MRPKFFAGVLFLTALLSADPVVHKFSLWDIGDKTRKQQLYWGWTNGFLQGRGDGADELDTCLSKMSIEQAVAMIDKYYKDHPERWSRAFGDEVLEALTVDGGPCEGKNVWVRPK